MWWMKLRIKRPSCLLSKLYDYSKQGIRVRSRAEWVENGGNNIQYFEQLLKSNKKKTVIRELYDKESKNNQRQKINNQRRMKY